MNAAVQMLRLFPDGRRCVPFQLTRHAEMNYQPSRLVPARTQHNNDRFSAPVHALYPGASQRGYLGTPAAIQVGCRQGGPYDVPAGQVGAQFAHHGFDFGELRHDAAVYTGRDTAANSG